MWRLRAKSGSDAGAEDGHTLIRMKEDVFEVKERGERTPRLESDHRPLTV